MYSLLTGGREIWRFADFICHTTGITVDVKFLCDGVEHCADGSDEKACEIINAGKFKIDKVTMLGIFQ